MQFLSDLTELSRKHGIAIGGCGCCGSPWLYDDEGCDFGEMAYVISEATEDGLEMMPLPKGDTS